MKAVLTDDIVRVVPEPSGESISIASLQKGDEFEIGKVQRKKKDVWVEVILANGTHGYIPGNTRIFAIKKVESAANPVEVHESPDDASPILITIPKKTAFTVRGLEKVGEDDWLVVELEDGQRGYARSHIKLRVHPEVTPQSARRMMITGGLFTLGGVILYVVGLNRTGTGDTSFITLGLILLGLYQVVQGYLQWQQVKKDEEEKK